jgi:RNA polymerase sigma-70 factor (ECF subfamily)
VSNADVKLIKRFVDGDASAFDALVERHRERVNNIALRMTGDRDCAEDITIDVFVKAHASLPAFEGRAKFTTWLHRLTVNVCLDYLRRRRAKRRIEEVPLTETTPVPAPSAVEIALNNHVTDQVLVALRSLPDPHRTAVTMFYLDGRTFGEIADILRISRSAVRSRISDGTQTLRHALQQSGVLPAGGRDS